MLYTIFDNLNFLIFFEYIFITIIFKIILIYTYKNNKFNLQYIYNMNNQDNKNNNNNTNKKDNNTNKKDNNKDNNNSNNK